MKFGNCALRTHQPPSECHNLPSAPKFSAEQDNSSVAHNSTRSDIGTLFRF